MKSILVKIALLPLIFCGTVPQNHHQDSPKFGSPQDVGDKEHLKQHLEEEVETDPKRDLTLEETRFHYFRMYDLNQDVNIDGVEICKLLVHSHDHQQQEKEEEYFRISDDELELHADDVLQQADLNMDGFIDWPEFNRYTKNYIEQQAKKANQSSNN